MNALRYILIRAAVATPLLLPVAAHAAANSQAQGLDAVGGQVGTSQAQSQIDSIINTIFYIAGAVAVIILIIGGVSYITSTGDSKRIQQAKDTIFYAIAGLIVVLLARVIIGFVIGSFAGNA